MRAYYFYQNLKTLPDISPNVKQLDCSTNYLKTLPKLLNVEELWCQYNQLKTLPDLPNIKKLDCFGNKFKDYSRCLSSNNNYINKYLIYIEWHM